MGLGIRRCSTVDRGVRFPGVVDVAALQLLGEHLDLPLQFANLFLLGPDWMLVLRCFTGLTRPWGRRRKLGGTDGRNVGFGWFAVVETTRHRLVPVLTLQPSGPSGLGCGHRG